MNLHKRVNQFLAESVSAINALMAIGIPVLAALVVGGLAGRFSFLAFLGGAIAGGVVGIFIAGPVCGVLAVLIDIRNSLEAQAARSSGAERQ